MKFLITGMMLFIGGSAMAHQWTPTYPKMIPSFVEGIYSTRLRLFNGRNDVSYYEFQVLDKDMNKVRFATPQRILPVKYLQSVEVEVYIREAEIKQAVYICSRSKLLAGTEAATVVSSRICSKIKDE